MPSVEFQRILDVFKEDYNCSYISSVSMYGCECTYDQYKNYPNLNIKIDDQIYFMNRENYIILYKNMCLFKVMSSTFTAKNGYWILGLTFFQNYYAIFD